MLLQEDNLSRGKIVVHSNNMLLLYEAISARAADKPTSTCYKVFHTRFPLSEVESNKKTMVANK